MLLSLFCGAGGLDLGFEKAGYRVELAFDIRRESIASYNHNRAGDSSGYCEDIRELTLDKIDTLHGRSFAPTGIIGGPPCQSFSRANKSSRDDDPRHELPFVYSDLINDFNKRHPVPFFVFENVPGINEGKHKERYARIKHELGLNFNLTEATLNSVDYGVAQTRSRLFLIGLNKTLFNDFVWLPPIPIKQKITVRDAIGRLPEPIYFAKGLQPSEIPYHRNHWCMQPKSKKFTTNGALKPGDYKSRSFKTLCWDSPSITAAYGNREVHVHPNCSRRLSVYEAMLIQGFPEDYELLGNLSQQITQVSEAVPPPLANAIAKSVRDQIEIIQEQQKIAV